MTRSDHLNTPRLIADDQQRTVWRWDNTDPFGGNPPDENPSGLGAFEFPLRLPGQYYDRETNLHYNYYRNFDPSLGRYVESDPIGLKAGLNTYAYVASSPLIYIDPSGLEIICYQWWNVETVTCEARCPPHVLGRGVGKYAGDAMLRAIANAKVQLPAGCGLGDPMVRAPDSVRILQQNECRPPLVLPPGINPRLDRPPSNTDFNAPFIR